MKIPASKVPAQVWADKARRRADLDEVESMLLSSWDDSKQVYRIGKELWDELRIDEADEVPVDAALAEEEARCEDDDDDGAPDIIKELFCELFRDDDCEGCPLHREGGGTTDSDELPGDGDLRMFMVSATPFPVWVRGEGFLSVKPYRVRRVTDVGDGFHDFLAEEVFANALTGRMRLLREKFGHKGRG